ncbi:hypothetical protein [Brevundimonas sp. UBA2416]|uniref:hypothetical protein n=1 Tax=Brevundimonas sp. UBA2416 TaxID=1946124 RepID=UPI0025BF829A|nr:hypothetical protein [Brevundimonas sp. UBA2416]HRJ62893.1 hypothetical protein [Brevundimonas sp.]
MWARYVPAVALAGGLIAPSAFAQELANPSWAAMPDGEAMAEAYPVFAYMAELDGDVILQCGIAADSTLSLCRAVEARPAGLGFDRAGLSVASLFRANPARVDGETVPSQVRFAVRFRMPALEWAPPWTGPEPTPEHLAAARAVVEERAAWDMRGPESFATMDLDVDVDREARVRAIVLAVKAEFLEQEIEAGALWTARLFTPEQIAEASATGEDPPPPPDDLSASAGDAWDRMGISSSQRLRQLYCAEFDCPTLPLPSPHAAADQ